MLLVLSHDDLHLQVVALDFIYKPYSSARGFLICVLHILETLGSLPSLFCAQLKLLHCSVRLLFCIDPRLQLRHVSLAYYVQSLGWWALRYLTLLS